MDGVMGRTEHVAVPELMDAPPASGHAQRARRPARTRALPRAAARRRRATAASRPARPPPSPLARSRVHRRAERARPEVRHRGQPRDGSSKATAEHEPDVSHLRHHTCGTGSEAISGRSCSCGTRMMTRASDLCGVKADRFTPKDGHDRGPTRSRTCAEHTAPALKCSGAGAALFTRRERLGTPLAPTVRPPAAGPARPMLRGTVAPARRQA